VDAVFAGEKNAVISQLPEMTGAIELVKKKIFFNSSKKIFK
jgi:hypothetical protein